MSRPLPLAGTGQEAAPASTALAGSVEVFDPAMCCSTGICGPGVDPALLAIARDLRWLEAHGVRVSRFGLTGEPQAFIANPGIQGLLQTFGDKALPAVLVNNEVLVHGRYPDREELLSALTRSDAETTGSARAASCCAHGSGHGSAR